MKTTLLVSLLAAAGVQAESPADAAAPVPEGFQEQLRIPVPLPPTGSSAKTSLAYEIKDGKATATLTVEKDGKTETRTFTLDENTPLKQLTDQLVEQLGTGAGMSAVSEPKRSVTYLGIMLDEAPVAGLGGGFIVPPGAGLPGGGLAPEPAPKAPGLPPGTGLNVTGVTADSPAAKAGLQSGDILTKLNDQILVNPAQFTTLVRSMKEGDVVKISFVRNGEQRQVDATLASRIEEASPAGLFGLGHAAFAPQLGRVLTLDPNGNVIESTPGALTPPIPPVPPLAPAAPGTPPVPSAPSGAPGSKAGSDVRPAWEMALREAAAAKEKATAQWQEQLSKWRAEWTEQQKGAAEEYRKAMEKMGEELAKAREAAEIARDEARRAIEEVRRKIEERRTKPGSEPQETKEGNAPSEPEQPKTT
jgi:hypothetical protein